MAGGGPVRLNVGCGRQVIDGIVNIDVVRSPNAKRDPELLCEMTAIPLPDGCADEVMAIHVLEHFYRWQVDEVITEWKRLLKSGGQLTLEMPDLFKCMQHILDGQPDNKGYWGLYGDPKHKDPYMCHRWGWTPTTLIALLGEHGFTAIAEETPEWHTRHKFNRDLRVTARKP